MTRTKMILILAAVLAVFVLTIAWFSTHDMDVDFSVQSKAKWEEWPVDYSQYSTVAVGRSSYDLSPGSYLRVYPPWGDRPVLADTVTVHFKK